MHAHNQKVQFEKPLFSVRMVAKQYSRHYAECRGRSSFSFNQTRGFSNCIQYLWKDRQKDLLWDGWQLVKHKNVHSCSVFLSFSLTHGQINVTVCSQAYRPNVRLRTKDTDIRTDQLPVLAEWSAKSWNNKKSRWYWAHAEVNNAKAPVWDLLCFLLPFCGVNMIFNWPMQAWSGS